jgi:hypothetical protein
MSLAASLEEARRALLDLSTRNRLLALPKPGRSRGVVIIEEEDAGFVFGELAAGKAFGFEAAGGEDIAKPARGTRPKAAGVTTARKGADGRQDALLRVRLPPAELTRRLRDLMADARSAREESGVPSLFLAIGALVWRDPATPEVERLAPLALLPAALEREGVSQKFRLRADPRELQENLSLREKLAVEFRIALPEFEAEGYTPTGWADRVAAAIAGREAWRVAPDTLAVGLFSFAKFIMWRDLDPAAQPGLLEHPLIRVLVGGEALPPQPPAFPDDSDVDAEIPVERLDHAMELDGSQALAVEAVRRGGPLVIQGPPGTGKSQTIVNILAQAVLDGRSALFVAEKAAALEVVKRRLDAVGLGGAVLELHSEKQSKRAVLDELRATLAALPVRAPDPAPVIRRLADLRGRLNRHATAMRALAGSSGLPVHEVVGRLAALRARGEAPPPFSVDATGWDAERLRALRDAVTDLASRAEAGAPRSPWRGVAAGFDALAAERLIARLPGLIRAFATAPGTPAEAERAPAPTEAGRAALEAWRELRTTTGFDAADTAFALLAERLAAWAAEPEALIDWQGWERAKEAVPELTPLADALERGDLAPQAAGAAFERAILESLLRAAMRDNPALAAFDGTAMDRLVEDFRAADAQRVKLTREMAIAAHAAALARIRAGEVAGLNILRGEFEKKRGHMPVRTLLTAAGPLVKAAKPILMMSPLSVAQFLNPTTGLRPGISFDLLVMDEASQIEPVDALGAIARAKQMVVVGDDKQMPPTRFFQRLTSEEEEAPAEVTETPVAAREVESILGLANARGVPAAMLRWHYRSRHESLIATSNAEFYGNRLLVLPSPRPRSPALGLSLIRIEGRFDTGGSGTNAKEAEAVAEAVLRHARETPGETLGVAAFSIRQRDAIIEALEALRRGSPETEGFFTAHEAEPFFVKNLENVQGDERDAILISIGYGRGADGKLAMRFGPLSAEGGERRLNVLITRAKRRCIVFSGIGAEEIDLSRAGGRGVAALKTFLHIAATPDVARRLGAGSASPLAGVIGGIVAEAGLEAVQHVGLSGVFLDVAARDAEGYRLGIETDGADWAARRCARDRDRGQQGALSGMGWVLARSWALDWLNRPQAATAALRAALGVKPDEASHEAPPPAGPGLAPPYVETRLEGAVPATPGGIATLIGAIIRTEAPIHRDAVIERARLLLGQAAPDAKGLAAALKEAELLHGAMEQGGFWRMEDGPPAMPRDRRRALPLLRRAAMVAPDEVAAAARVLRELQLRADDAELAAGVVRLLGLEAAAGPGIAARLALLSASGGA